MFGDGSDGALTITSGNYAELVPDHKYQYSSVNIQSGGTLYAYDQVNYTGTVLYILCTGTFTVDGTIDLTYAVNAGNRGYTATVNGESFTSAGVQAGGNGEGRSGVSGGTNGLGFGGGGAGGAAYLGGQAANLGGAGGNGGPDYTGGGGSQAGPIGSNGYYPVGGNAGFSSQGGGGASFLWRSVTSGTGSPYARGGAASGGAGTINLNNFSWGGSSSNFIVAGAGGGGSGGYAGYPGLHLVIKAPTIIIHGTINVSGGDGSTGSIGGASREGDARSFGGNVYPAPPSYALEAGGAGGGGGGGNGGNVKLVYSASLTNTGSILVNGGAAGASGGGGATAGAAGTSGSFSSLTAGGGWMPFFI